MEKKQLNFSAPLMSARRYSSPLRSSGEDQKRVSPLVNQKSVSCHKSDLSSAEVVKPGSVPFTWEQVPGRAKEKNHLPLTRNSTRPSIPKLPPGRTCKSGELLGFRHPNMSGELTTSRYHNFSGELNTLRSKNRFSGELNALNKIYSLNESVLWGPSKEETDMSLSSESRDKDDDETFSRPELSSVNCSFSGLSGPERANQKPCDSTVSTDRRSRDFMMDRFLPAAKAMTLEPSQYASKKQGVEQSKEIKVPMAVKLPSRKVISNIVPYKGQDIGSENSEDDVDRCDEQSILSVKIKACGFLPWSRTKKFLCLLHGLPSLKNRSKGALSTSKLSLAKSSSWKSSAANSTKHDPCSDHKKKPNEGFKSCELQIPKYTSRPMFYSGELHTRSTSPYRSNNRRSNTSPYRSESPHSISHKHTNSNDNRMRTPQKSRTLLVPKSETASRYGGRNAEIIRARGMSGPLVCGAVHTNVPSKDSSAVQSTFTPPLPKSPSESWLSRKLPLVSPRNSVSHSSLSNKMHSSKQNAKTTDSIAKWETIVRSSHLRHDRGWYPEELVTHGHQLPQKWM